MSRPDPKKIEDLLAHSDWVRRVARGLVGDVARADDLVQESWLAALRRPPKRSDNLRGWLGQVVRRQALQSGRSESRRRVREEIAARPEASLEDLAQRASTQRDVVGHVLALEEPFRSVVLLRFFEDQTPPQIAERLDIPLKTVHSRLARAFAKLRTRLDSEYGSSEAWAALVLPLAALAPSSPTAASLAAASSLGASQPSFTLPLWIMKTQAKLAAAAAFVLLGGWALWQLGSSPDASPSGEIEMPKLAGAEPAREASPELAQLDAPDPADRLATGAEEAKAAPAPAAAEAQATRVTVQGKVVDLRGQPVADVLVSLLGDDVGESVSTARDGSFELAIVGDPHEDLPDRMRNRMLGLAPQAGDQDWITLRHSYIESANLDEQHLVVVTRARELEGWVQDSAGTPIEGASVNLMPQTGTFQDFPLPLDMTRLEDFSGETDAAGRFALSPFPDEKRLGLIVRASGFVSAGIDLDNASWPLIVELARPEESGKVMLEGSVVDRRGEGVEGAQVQLGSSRTTSGPSGLFRLPVPYLSPHTPLCAGKPGFQPGLIPNFVSVLESADGQPDPVLITLGGPSLSMEGQVVDAGGAPLSGWVVSITNETEISQFQIPIESAEALSRPSTGEILTDSSGRFRVDGLIDRDYVLQAYDKDSLLRTEETVHAGGSPVRLVVQTGLVAEVSGQVVSLDGTPVSGVSLKLNLPIAVGSIGHSAIGGAEVISDEEGRFVLRDVPEQFVHLYLHGEAILNGRHDFTDDFGSKDQRVLVERRCHFQIELSAEHAHADDAWFEDDEGARQQVNRIEGGGMSSFTSVPLADGKSQVLSVSEAASTLILAAEGGVIARLPLQLRADEVTQLRP